jgi:hypothetical protein
VILKITTYRAILLAAVLSAGFGFVLHVFATEIISPYVASVMAGRRVVPSWDVRIPAALSSIEQGIAVALLYLLVRFCLPSVGTLRRGLLVGVLALALGGNLVRQPMMNLLIGNPLAVVAMQDGVTWVIWLVMGLISAVCLDTLVPRSVLSV